MKYEERNKATFGKTSGKIVNDAEYFGKFSPVEHLATGSFNNSDTVASNNDMSVHIPFKFLMRR